MRTKSQNELHKRVLKLMKVYGIDAYLSYTADCHHNEYIGTQDLRVTMLTGFTGSNGIAMTAEVPLLWTDGRYYIQAERESTYSLRKEAPSEVARNFKKISFDLRLVSTKFYDEFTKKLKEKGVEFVAIDENLVDRAIEEINRERGVEEKMLELDGRRYSLTRRVGDVTYLENYQLIDFVADDLRAVNYLKAFGFTKLDENVSGSSYQDKIGKVREVAGDRTLLVTELDTICWILNVRGNEIDYNPLFYGYLVLSRDDVILFVDSEVYLKGVATREYRQFEEYLNEKLVHERVLVSSQCSQYLANKMVNAEFTEEIRIMQSKKNQTELAGMTLAYYYDGIALTNLLGHLSRSKEEYTEKQVADLLLRYKKNLPGFVQPSFETISCTGSNAAIIHHSPSDAVVDYDSVYLIDSGSQYLFGTTDTTRTCHFRKPAPELVHDNTLVLKCQLNAMMKVFKEEAEFSELDEAGRIYLKNEEKEFKHGLSHGVGHFLCVHEHPPIISPNKKEAFYDNCVFSVEPGFYLENEYGIRIENLVYCKKNKEAEGGYSLVNLTMVPYDQGLIDQSMLNEQEKAYLNTFNQLLLELFEGSLNEEGWHYLKSNAHKIV
ncbi:AMPP1 [Enterospora canceri]|uniref:AMPP1 n=1 Tax=Enterospora canceri TaxID=1081671 RepID=A0A1Y1S7Y6_9MICR|nr:AMPP1 [Enterospora canceri]